MRKCSAHQRDRRGFFANVLRGLFSGDPPGRTDAGRRKRTGLDARRLRFECCEDRHLLSSVGVVFNDLTGVLTLTGSTGPDQVRLVGQPSYLDIYVGGSFQARLLNANSNNVSQITFDGKAGKDSLAVQNVPGLGGNLPIGLTDVETVGVLKGANVTVTANGALALGASTITGALGVTAGGAITQSGQATVMGSTTLNAGAGNDITLSNASNNFNSIVIVGGRNVALRDVNAIVLGTMHVYGDLSVQANLNTTSRVAVSQSGPLTVDGSTTLTVGRASTITLNSLGNTLHGPAGAVSVLAAANATLTNSAAAGTKLGASSVTGNLNVTATTGGITQGGPLVVGRMATLSAPAGHVTLTDASNNFSTLLLTTNNASLRDVNALTFAASTLGGTLDVTTDGAIRQSGKLVVGGPATLTAGEDSDILLNNSGNDFAAIGIVSGRNVTLRDKNALGLLGSAVSGNLSVTTAGPITQPLGLLTVAGKATLAAGSLNDIHLAAGDNSFNEVAVTSCRDLSLGNTGPLLLGTSRVSGQFFLDNRDGEVTQSGPLAVKTGDAMLATTAGNIILDNPRNDFLRVLVSASSSPGQNVWLRDINAMILGNVAVSGDLSLQANLNSSNRVALSQAYGTTLSVDGATTLAVGPASTIRLDAGSNAMAGEVSILSGANATLANEDALLLGASRVTGNLNALVAGGGITQSGPLVVGRTATFNAAAADVVLTDPDNDFRTFQADANNVQVNDVNALTLGGSGIGGYLEVTTDGAITQSGALSVVGGPATFSAGVANDIALLDMYNYFVSVGITSGQNVALRSDSMLTLDASTVSGNLDLVTWGDVTQNGAVEVAGKTTIEATGVILDDAGNNFSEAALATGSDAWLTNAGALVLGTSNIAGSLTLMAAGGVTQTGPLAVGNETNLAATDGSNLFEIALVNPYNNFANTVMLFAGDVALRDRDTLNLGYSYVEGALSATAGANISQSDSLEVTGAATFATNVSADVILNDSANRFTEVAVTSANNVVLSDADELLLGASNVSGMLSVATVGDLTQSGPVAVAGDATLTVGANDITLTDPDNDFYTVILLSARNVSLADVDELMLGDATLTGDLSVTAGGEITDASTISVAGNATLVAGTLALPYDITLDSTTSTYRGTLSLQGNNVSVRNNYATVLGDCSATGDLTVTTSGGSSTLTNLLDPGPPTVNGILSVVGVTTLDAGPNALTLYEAGCTFTGGVFLTGSPVTVVPANHAPLLAGIEGTALNYTVSSPATAVTSSITVADLGSPLLAGATIRITGNYLNGADVLSFTNTGSITGTWNAATGTLTLSGADTVANYEAALRSVKFFSSAVGTNPRTVTFKVNDGAADSNSVTRDIMVNP